MLLSPCLRRGSSPQPPPAPPASPSQDAVQKEYFLVALAKPKRDVLPQHFNPGEEVLGALSQIGTQIGSQMTGGWQRLTSLRASGPGYQVCPLVWC